MPHPNSDAKPEPLAKPEPESLSKPEPESLSKSEPQSLSKPEPQSLSKPARLHGLRALAQRCTEHPFDREWPTVGDRVLLLRWHVSHDG